VVATTSLESNKSYEEVKSLDENKNTLNLNENKDTLDDKETTYGINSNISDVNQKDSCGSADMQEECDQVVDTLLKTPTPISVEEDVTELDSTLQSYDSELKKPTDMVITCPNESGVEEDDHEEIDCMQEIPEHLRQQDEIMQRQFKNWRKESTHYVMDEELPPDDDVESNLQDEGEDPDSDLNNETPTDNNPKVTEEEDNDYENKIVNMEKVNELDFDGQSVDSAEDYHKGSLYVAKSMRRMRISDVEFDKLISEVKEDDNLNDENNNLDDEFTQHEKQYLASEKKKLRIAFFVILFVHSVSCTSTFLIMNSVRNYYREKYFEEINSLTNQSVTDLLNVTTNDNDYAIDDRERVHS